jgi:hypothetical protein
MLCREYAKIGWDFNVLKLCLKTGQTGEALWFQGKFSFIRNLSPDLSTGIVDSFPLAAPVLALQRCPGIIISHP